MRKETKNTMLKFFNDCKTLDELKAMYRKLANKFHPDHGGDAETMKAINAEHDSLFEILKNRHNATCKPEYKTTETAEEFRNIIDALFKLGDDIEIELCGRWLWIDGNTRPHKEALKACGCKWSANKKKWYWHHIEDGATFNRKSHTMEQIRNAYGSYRILKDGTEDRQEGKQNRNPEYLTA